MKTLENLKEFQLKNEMKDFTGGVPVNRSGTLNGSAWSVSGDMFGTSRQYGAGGFSITTVDNDFTGCVTADGREACNTWVNVGYYG